MRPHPLLETKQYSDDCEHALGAERRLLEAVLIHKHRARLSPRLIPGTSPRSALHNKEARRDPPRPPQLKKRILIICGGGFEAMAADGGLFWERVTRRRNTS